MALPCVAFPCYTARPMIAEELLNLLGPRLSQSLEGRGFAELTAVQAAVLDPSLADSDLRITSQTGSGKTVAIGLVLRHAVETHASIVKPQGPCAMIVVPTRELAKQVHDELSWLFAPLKIRLACVTGGSSYRDERRALGVGPSVVIGTPGRLLDHLQRGAFDAATVATIVLDEADRMLDLGFADAIEAIFLAAPNRKYTHLMSATLAPEVLRLADRFQAKPRQVQGSRPGQAHADIEHLVHLVPTHRRLDALVNVLLAEPDERTLVFVRTRADVGNIAQQLSDAGFRVATLSGDMEQPARERALAAFRKDKVRVLVATDVAARGIDIQGMTRVIHIDPPTDPDSYTHRSGRTGRAGQKGSSIVFVAPERQRQLRTLLSQARVSARLLPLPNVETLRKTADARTLKSLIDALGTSQKDARQRKLAEDLLRDNDAADVVAMLIARTKSTEPEPRQIDECVMPERIAPSRRARQHAAPTPPNTHWARAEQAERSAGKPFQQRHLPLDSSRPTRFDGWGMFHVTWGQLQGADPRRMLAVVCRRGNIRGADVGAIRIGPTSTIVEVRHQVAAEFAVRAKQPDPEEPRIRITELEPPNHPRSPRLGRPTRARA
jgi:ATP-dependent RNA helicase DeaD